MPPIISDALEESTIRTEESGVSLTEAGAEAVPDLRNNLIRHGLAWRSRS